MSAPERHVPSVTRLTKQPGIRETVTRALRSAVISGELQPGRVYSAPSLAAQFGISATPIREAMLDLVHEGLVVALPNRGFQVTEVSALDLAEVTELRLLLEPPAIAKATPRIPAADLPGLRAQADAIFAAASRGDLVDYLSLDNDFHLTLLGYAGNRRLVAQVQSLRSQTRLFGLAGLHARGRLTDSAREHDEILDAIAARDAARAAALMQAHIEHVLGDWSAPAAAATEEAQ